MVRARSVKELELEYQTWDSEKLLDTYRDNIFAQTKKQTEGGWKEVVIMNREILRRLTEWEKIVRID